MGQQSKLLRFTRVECSGYTLTPIVESGFTGGASVAPNSVRGITLTLDTESGAVRFTLQLRAVFAPRSLRLSGGQQPLYHGSTSFPERYDIDLNGDPAEIELERAFLGHMRQLLTIGTCVYATIDDQDPSQANIEVRGCPADEIFIALLDQMGKLGQGHTFTELPSAVNAYTVPGR